MLSSLPDKTNMDTGTVLSTAFDRWGHNYARCVRHQQLFPLYLYPTDNLFDADEQGA